MNKLLPALVSAIVFSGCTTAAQHRADVQDDSSDRITVGVVQKEIRLGMSSADVIAALGSPNIVSTDDDRNEVWVYDKLATDVAYSDSNSAVLGLILGPVGSVNAAALGSKRYSAGASSTSQRTLTVVINFDAHNHVSDFAYHSSRF